MAAGKSEKNNKGFHVANRFTQIFNCPKPILGMLHLSGASASEKLEIARRETETLIENGVDGVVVENYFGDASDVQRVLDWLAQSKPATLVGVNVLRDYRLAFSLARQFPVDFIQIDSVAGHLAPMEDEAYGAELAQLRQGSNAALLGGVRFKYQPVKSGRSEAEDIRIGMTRCDALVITGEATGLETDLQKVRRFRAVTGADFPLLIGAGLTAANAAIQMREADGAIVGSFFKHNHTDSGIVLGAHVAELMETVRQARQEAGNLASRRA